LKQNTYPPVDAVGLIRGSQHKGQTFGDKFFTVINFFVLCCSVTVDVGTMVGREGAGGVFCFRRPIDAVVIVVIVPPCCKLEASSPWSSFSSRSSSSIMLSRIVQTLAIHANPMTVETVAAPMIDIVDPLFSSPLVPMIFRMDVMR
jgi:hypothetical protein